ncbi:MAG TPA: response regulator [Tepidisphaeraceae bacterium]|nr:response regulator [Tepidisphaeraceae bacterium]
MILVVDDHADTRVALARLLTLHGYEAAALADGVEALRFLESHTPKLMILDFNMPGLNGHDVLRAVRCDARLRDVPVLIFTAEDSEQRQAESRRLGAQGHIVKGCPHTYDFLLAQVRRYTANGDGAAR